MRNQILKTAEEEFFHGSTIIQQEIENWVAMKEDDREQAWVREGGGGHKSPAEGLTRLFFQSRRISSGMIQQDHFKVFQCIPSDNMREFNHTKAFNRICRDKIFKHSR